MSLFSTPSPPSEAGGTGPAGGRPDFPSPTKLVRNGLTGSGTELGAQTQLAARGKIHCVKNNIFIHTRAAAVSRVSTSELSPSSLGHS